MKKKTYAITGAILLFCICTAFILFRMNALATVDKNVICEGVFIDSVDVSGKTKEQAEQAVEQYIEKRKNAQITVKVDKHNIKVNLKDLGYERVPDTFVDDALLVGKSGNLIKRYKELKDIEAEKLVYSMKFQLDDLKLNNFIKEKCSEYDVKSKDAGLKRENGKFIVTASKTGRKIVADETAEKIKSTVLSSEWDGNDTVIEAVVIEDIPKYTEEEMGKIQDVLGTYQTTYHSSSYSRANNLANAAKFINGTLVYPGETFSCYELMNPFTTDNGYSAAGAYAQGKVVDSIGGGVCQVSSTLYNAVLRSELEVVERSPHSMIVNYVDPAADAAIAGTYKDLKFKNNYDMPIYIEAYTKDRTITFTIYGEETRDKENRKVEYVSEVTARIAPPADVVTKDPTKPENYFAVTQSSHTGMRANLYKVVTVDGKEVERTLVNTSTYAAAPRYVTVGVKKEEPEPEETDEDKDTDKDKDTDNETDNKEDNKDKTDNKDKNKIDDKISNQTEKPKNPEQPDQKNETDNADNEVPVSNIVEPSEEVPADETQEPPAEETDVVE